MDAELYQKLFLLAAKIEEAHAKNPVTFQYIITTTEPPPQILQKSPWLLEPVLDASTASGKLLTEHFLGVLVNADLAQRTSF